MKKTVDHEEAAHPEGGLIDHLCRNCGAMWPAPNSTSRSPQCPSCGARRVVRHAHLFSFSMAHVDCDAFYASIHKRDQPELKDQPVLVGGGRRGVVAAACYLARARGVHSAMPMFKALALCPEAVVIKPQMELYAKEGKAIRERMLALTPLVQPVSIDEAYLDLSGTARLHAMPPAAALARLQQDVLTAQGLTISVGLSSNRFLAKLASDLDKPHGFAVLAPVDVPSVLWAKPVTALHGIGPAMARTMGKLGISTVGDLAQADRRRVLEKLGPEGLRWIDLAHGRDTRPVETEHVRKSISAETTFNDDISDSQHLDQILLDMCEEVGRRARKEDSSGRSITLKVKTSHFKIITRRVTQAEPTATARVILAATRPLLADVIHQGPFRLLGVGLGDLAPLSAADHGDLVNAGAPRLAALERAMDKVNAKFGAGMLASGLASKRGNSKSKQGEIK